MKLKAIHPTIAEAIELPRLVALGDNLFGAAFNLMKLLPARHILDRAREEGLLRPDSVIIETTSGTFGLALAILSALRGYRLIIVSDPVIDEPLKRRLEDLGAVVDIVQDPAPIGGYQQSRLDRVAELGKQYPDHFWPSQYENPDNPGAYAHLAEFLEEALGEVDALVGTVGSGGSMCGTATALRKSFPHLYAVGVDTHGSVLFGGKDEKRLLRGLGNSLMPKNLDHTVFDEVHWVSSAEAFHATRQLHRRHGLFMGGTSGAAYMVAKWYAERNPDQAVVCMLPDEGHRYQDTIYSEAWLQEKDVWLPGLPDEPKLVEHRDECDGEWGRMLWGRHPYVDVIGEEFQP